MRAITHTEQDRGRDVTSTQLLVDGHDVTRSDAIAQARQWLAAEAGMTPAAAEDATVDGPGRVGRAWWLDDARGFGQEHHDGAAPVTVVHVDGAR